MSEPEQRDSRTNAPEEENPPSPNLTLLYSLIVLALAAAIAIATMIVLPFYRRR
jgi:hypothetical protein